MLDADRLSQINSLAEQLALVRLQRPFHAEYQGLIDKRDPVWLAIRKSALQLKRLTS